MIREAQPHTVINSYVQSLLSTAYAKGFSDKNIFEPFGGKGMPDKPGGRMSMTLMTKLWQRVADLTKDPDLGLHVGEKIKPGSFHIVSQIANNTQTVREAQNAIIKYQRLASEGGVLRQLKTKSGVELIYTPQVLSIPMTRFQIECVLSSLVMLARWFLDVDVSPLKVGFSHSVDHDPKEYHRIFKCPVYFNEKENFILISDQYLSMKIPHSDPELRKRYEQIADQLMENLIRKNRLSQDLKKWLQSRSDIRQASIESAASYCKMAPRTLQRKLMQENTSYNDLKCSILMEAAHDLLIHTDMPVSDIVEKLGYINNSSFHRGFKKWFNMTPLQYRKRLVH